MLLTAKPALQPLTLPFKAYPLHFPFFPNLWVWLSHGSPLARHFCRIFAKFFPGSAAVDIYYYIASIITILCVEPATIFPLQMWRSYFVNYFCSEMLFLMLCLDFASQCATIQPQKWAQKDELICARSHSFGQLYTVRKIAEWSFVNVHLVSVVGQLCARLLCWEVGTVKLQFWALLWLSGDSQTFPV